MGPLTRKKQHRKRIYKSFSSELWGQPNNSFSPKMPRLSKIRMQKQFYTKKDFVGIINLLIVWRGKVVTSRCHGSEPWSCRYSRKKKKTKKLTCMTFRCFMVLKNKMVMQMAVSVKKDCSDPQFLL